MEFTAILMFSFSNVRAIITLIFIPFPISVRQNLIFCNSSAVKYCNATTSMEETAVSFSFLFFFFTQYRRETIVEVNSPRHLSIADSHHTCNISRQKIIYLQISKKFSVLRTLEFFWASYKMGKGKQDDSPTFSN